MDPIPEIGGGWGALRNRAQEVQNRIGKAVFVAEDVAGRPPALYEGV